MAMIAMSHGNHCHESWFMVYNDIFIDCFSFGLKTKHVF